MYLFILSPAMESYHTSEIYRHIAHTPWTFLIRVNMEPNSVKEWGIVEVMEFMVSAKLSPSSFANMKQYDLPTIPWRMIPDNSS